MEQKKVLIVDDEPDIREILELLLKSKEEYKTMPLEDFFRTAFERLQRIIEFTK